MKKNIIGAIVLVAAIAFAGCNNNQKNDKEETKQNEQVEAQAEPQLPNRLLIIVDPQIDFTTGSLATKNGPAAMDCVLIDINDKTGRAEMIERFTIE